MIKLSVSIFGQTTGYRIYTVSRDPIRLSSVWYLINVFINAIFGKPENFQKHVTPEELGVLKFISEYQLCESLSFCELC